MTRSQFAFTHTIIKLLLGLIEQSSTSMPAADITMAGVRLCLYDRTNTFPTWCALVIVGDGERTETERVPMRPLSDWSLRSRAYEIGDGATARDALLALGVGIEGKLAALAAGESD